MMCMLVRHFLIWLIVTGRPTLNVGGPTISWARLCDAQAEHVLTNMH